MAGGTDAIDPDEIVYRRVAVKNGFYKPAAGYLSPRAFRPVGNNDPTGISLSRAAKLKGPPAETAAEGGFLGTEYWIIALRVGDLIAIGLDVVVDKPDEDPSHACLPALNSGNVKSDQAEELMDKASRLPRQVLGPFPGKRPRPTPPPAA